MSFKRLDQEDISISAESVVAPLWTTDDPTLTSFHTSSTQVASAAGKYYYDVYHLDPATNVSTARVQYSLAFGDKTGRGGERYNDNVDEKTPTSTIYGQYRNLVFGDEDTDFTFGTNTSNYFYAINVERARYKEKLLPGSFNLKLTFGSNTLHLTDNSKDVTTVSFSDSGRVYEVISGSDGSAYSGTGYDSSNNSYGKFLPDVGVILLNGTALNQAAPDGLGAGFTTLSTDTDDANLDNLHGAIATGQSFKLQSEETISSNFVFVRVRNSEFNYSSNPSNITGSGELRHDVMINSPQAYITTVGLYNDSNDLLAIAKLSRPLLKDFTKEALVRIKLDY